MEDLKPSQANSSPLTPLGFIDRAATVYGDCTSILYNNTSYTWTQTHRRCLQLASSLSSNGIQRGHVVSVISPNTPAMYELHFAVPMSGAILNTINTRLDARTVSLLLRHSESRLVFVDILYVSLIFEAISLYPKELCSPLLVLIEDEYAETESGTVSTVDFDRFLNTYERLISEGDPSFKWIPPFSEWDPMVLNYTSGTTSAPKGVVHCHRGIFIVTVDSIVDWAVPKRPVYLWTLPMFHCNGWSFPWAIAALGGTNVCLRKIETSAIYDLIRRLRVTHMCAAPVVLNMLANSPEPLRNPVHILAGGSPPPAAVLLRAESLGFDVRHVYGMTETGGVIISCEWKSEWDRLPATERARLKSRQGVRTLAMNRVDVVDVDSGRSVIHDGRSTGEVVLQGGSVMLGYLKDPDATRKCMTRDGWLYTGDTAVIHRDGYLEIRDRSKDIIISGGENVSSVEVEAVLYNHPAVDEAAVVARPDEFWGETPCAFVSLKRRSELSGIVSEREIIEFCRERLPGFMVPKTVAFKEQLPKTSTGKIQKFVLRELAKAMGPIPRNRL